MHFNSTSYQMHSIGDPNEAQAGCFVLDQLKALPLTHLSYDIEIDNCLSKVTIRQSFLNSSEDLLEVHYLFPLAPSACLYSFEASFGDKRLKGLVKERKSAEQEFKQAKKEGRRAALGTLNKESRDLMRLQLGNIPEHQEVHVTLVYLQELSVVSNTFYHFRLPTTVTPRYASRMDHNAFLHIKKGAVRVEGKCSWTFSLSVKSKLSHENYKSSHHLKKVQSPPNLSLFELDEGQNPPSKDLSFYYTVNKIGEPRINFQNTDECSTAIVSFIPEFFPISPGDAYESALKNQPIPISMQSAKAEYLFLLDRSGSMGGSRIQRAKQSLILFLKSLPEDSYFNVISFGTNYQLLFSEGSKRNEKKSVDSALKQIQEMAADMGGTEILQALKRIFEQKIKEGYPRQVFLLTDGSVFNTENVIQFVGQNTDYSRVHSIGVGDGCSRALIEGCAQSGKGYYIYVQDKQDPSPKVIKLLDQALSPVISNMKIQYDDSKVARVQPNPKLLPYILKDQLACIYFTFLGKLKQDFPISITYNDSVSGIQKKISLVVKPQSQNCQFVEKMADFKLISALEWSLRLDHSYQDKIFFVKPIDKEKLRQQLISQSVKKQILSYLTAFICLQAGIADYQAMKNRQNIKQTNQIIVRPNIPLEVAELQLAQSQYYYFDQIQDQSEEYENQCSYQMMETPLEPDCSYKKGNQRPLVMFHLKPSAPSATEFSTVNGRNEEDRRRDPRKIVARQQVGGQWKEEQILRDLYGEANFKNLKNAMKSERIEIWVTLSVLNYMEKLYGSQVEYTLILRKARSFLSKQLKPQLQKDLSERINALLSY